MKIITNNQIIHKTGNTELMLSKEREIFKNICYYQRLNKKDELSKKIDYGYLKFIVNSSGLETDFSELKGRVAFLDNTKKREISIEEARIKQKESNRYLKKIRTGNESEKKTLANINRLFN